MTKRMTRVLVKAFLGAAIVAGVSSCGRGATDGLVITGAHPTKLPNGWSDTEATFTLREVSGVCALSGKDTEVEVANNKKVTWTVRNFCPQPQTVTIGNFRTGASTRTDCAQPIEDIAWPFNSNDRNINKRQATVRASNGTDPEEAKFRLQDAKNTTGKPLEYQFDVCVGSGNGTKVDPRLVIDP